MKNKNKIKLLVFGFICFLVVVGFLLPNLSLAQEGEIEEGLTMVGEETGLGAEDPRIIVARIIRIFLGFLGVVAIAIVIYAGFLYMTSGGAEQKVEKAKKWLINSVIGLIIILSAFALTTYIINRLGEATGAEGYISEGGGAGGGGIGGGGTGGADVFNVSLYPKGDNRPINSVVKVIFPPDKDPIINDDYQNIKNNIKVYLLVYNEENELESKREVDGFFNVDGKQIVFTPSSSCPAGCDSENCFDADSSYQIEILKGLQSTDQKFVRCPLSAEGYCLKSNFSIGDQCDTKSPSVNIFTPIFPIMHGELGKFEIEAVDEFGLTSLKICPDAENEPENCDEISTGDNSPTEYSYIYNFDTIDYELGKYQVKAFAYDSSNNEGSKTRDYTIASANCFDENNNFDCTLAGCELDADDPACDISDWPWPIIASVNPDNGAAGEFITIKGSKFGNYGQNSKVTFNGVEAQPACDAKVSWTDTQVVVQVPTAATSGPIVLTNNDGNYYDSADEDSPGWTGDFQVNDEAGDWIGLCAVENKKTGDNSGASGDLAFAYGVNFGDSQGEAAVYFGNIPSGFNTTWSDEVIKDIKIPNINEGQVTVQVSRGDVYSNAVDFYISQVKSDIEITSVSPNPAPPAQYITISGKDFGSNGSVNLKKESQVYTASLGCAGAWQDTQIVAVLPDNIPDGEYLLEVVSGNAKADVDFTIDSSVSLTPGICEIKPDNGPAGSNVTISGTGFGSELGKVVFAGGYEVFSNFDWSSSEISEVMVPAGARTGDVYVETAEGLQSNKVKFEVKSCTKDSQCNIDIGEICCNNKYCSMPEDCLAAEPTNCEYSWYFSTGVLPKVPKIIERSCTDDFNESPSPGKNSNNACPNGQIGFTFNMLMNTASILNKVEIKKCEADSENCNFDIISAFVPTAMEFFQTNYPGTDGPEVTSVIIPSYKLEPNYKYLVTVKAGASAAENDEYVSTSDYIWTFQTAENNCEIKNIIINPLAGLITEIYDNQKYFINGQAENCGIIDVDVFENEWNWTLEPFTDGLQRIKRLLFVDGQQLSLSDSTAYFEPNIGLNIDFSSLETPKDEPGIINLAGTITNDLGDVKAYSASASLVVKFSEPVIDDYWPDCDEACRNALIGATFSTFVRQGDLQNTQNIKLYKCTEKDCDKDLILPVDFNYKIETADCEDFGNVGTGCREVHLIPNPPARLDNDTYYRVVFSDLIHSLSDYALSDLNYIDGEGAAFDSFSWIFKTRNNINDCRLETIQVQPVKKIVDEIDIKIEYFAYGLSEPDKCDSDGQKVNPFGYDWSWSEAEGKAVIQDLNLPFNKDNYSDKLIAIFTNKYGLEENMGCDDNCLNLGSESYEPKCGNEIIEIGEECEIGVTAPNVACTENCLFAGFDEATCGNGVIDGEEECDDGNNNDDDGCSFQCLNEGASVTGLTCGNGEVQAGEDNDYGSAELNTLYGLGSNCLHVGSTYTAEDKLAICGNEVIEEGEECEASLCTRPDGSPCNFSQGNCLCNFEDDLYCTENCLLKGFPSCEEIGSNVNCCGNGIYEEYTQNGKVYFEECELQCEEKNIYYSAAVTNSSLTNPLEACEKYREENLTIVIPGATCVCNNAPDQCPDEIKICVGYCSENPENSCLGSSADCSCVAVNDCQDADKVCPQSCSVAVQDCAIPEWCTNNCLNKGANALFGSFCKDGIKGNGEDVACEQGVSGNLGSPYALVQMLGNLANINLEDLTGQINFSDTALIHASVSSDLPFGQEGGIPISSADTETGGELTYNWNSNKNSLTEVLDIEEENNLCDKASIYSSPDGANLCKNAVIEIIIDKPIYAIDEEFDNNEISLTYVSTIAQADMNWVQKIVYKVKYFIKKVFGQEAVAQTAEYRVEKRLLSDNKTKLSIIPIDIIEGEQIDTVFEANAVYVIKFADKAIENFCKEVINDLPDITFTTNDSFCQFTSVYVDPSYHMFNRTGEVTDVIHEARSGDLTIHPVPGVYAWNWSDWVIVNPAGVNVVNNIETKEGCTCTDSGKCEENLSIFCKQAVAGTQNGQAQIIAEAIINTDPNNITPQLYYPEEHSKAGEPIPKSLSNSGTMEVFLCENVWKWPKDIERTYNVSLVYCRDSGEVNEVQDDLPGLKAVSGLSECNDGVDNDGDGLIDYGTNPKQTKTLMTGDAGFVFSGTANQFKIKLTSIDSYEEYVSGQSGGEQGEEIGYAAGTTIYVANIKVDKNNPDSSEAVAYSLTAGQSKTINIDSVTNVKIKVNQINIIDDTAAFEFTRQQYDPDCASSDGSEGRGVGATGNCNDGIDNDGDGAFDYAYAVDIADTKGYTGPGHEITISSRTVTVLEVIDNGALIQVDGVPEAGEYVYIGEPKNIQGLIFDFNPTPPELYGLSIKNNPDPQCEAAYDLEEEKVIGGKKLAEYFFLRDTSEEQYDFSPDAISMRIYENPENISAREWYDKYVPNKAGGEADISVNCTPALTTCNDGIDNDSDGFVDYSGFGTPDSDCNSFTDSETGGASKWCYSGVRDGNTIYISGANLNLGNNTLYNNIYVFGYSIGSNSNTTNIFAQMVEYLRLNTNLDYSDQYSANDINAVKRDVSRINDINYLKKLFASYKSQKGGNPNLNSGTYDRGKALSTWPSWQSVLGNELGSALPSDPVNSIVSGTCSAKSVMSTCYDSENQTIGIENFSDIWNGPNYIYGYSYDENQLYYNLEGDYNIFGELSPDL